MTSSARMEMLQISNFSRKTSGWRWCKWEGSMQALFLFSSFLRFSYWCSLCSLDESISALIHLHNFELMGQNIRVSFSKQPITTNASS